MNSTTEPVIAPTVAVPGLVIHPSIPADLANEMLRVADLFHARPELYKGDSPWLIEQCGCICAHITNRSIADETGTLTRMINRWPNQYRALQRIFSEAASDTNPAWAIARIEHFLRTAQ